MNSRKFFQMNKLSTVLSLIQLCMFSLTHAFVATHLIVVVNDDWSCNKTFFQADETLEAFDSVTETGRLRIPFAEWQLWLCRHLLMVLNVFKWREKGYTLIKSTCRWGRTHGKLFVCARRLKGTIQRERKYKNNIAKTACSSWPASPGVADESLPEPL